MSYFYMTCLYFYLSIKFASDPFDSDPDLAGKLMTLVLINIIQKFQLIYRFKLSKGKFRQLSLCLNKRNCFLSQTFHDNNQNGMQITN